MMSLPTLATRNLKDAQEQIKENRTQIPEVSEPLARRP